jgi:hypothetical protein
VSALLVLIVIPAVVTLLKGHWGLFGLGLIFLGIIWWIAALRLAHPESVWARRLYGERKLDRARARYGGGSAALDS